MYLTPSVLYKFHYCPDLHIQPRVVVVRIFNKKDKNEAKRTKSSTRMERAQKTKAEGKARLTPFDTWEATLAIPSTLIGGSDVEKNQRLRLDGLESRAKTNEVGSVSCT
ncbi:hypothetical protein Tco_1065426 [Tanacetum coccineum]